MRIKIDQDRFAEAGLSFSPTEGGQDGTFHSLDTATGEPLDHYDCRVAIVDGELEFYPRRSAAQRAVLARLGESISG